MSIRDIHENEGDVDPRNGCEVDTTQAFDRIARAHHAAALAALSTRTRTQLHNRLQATLAGNARRPPTRSPLPAWSWAAAAVIVLAFAFGAPWRSLHDPVPSPRVATNNATPADATNGNAADSAVATLDQNPDFYLWLASSDAVALAAE